MKTKQLLLTIALLLSAAVAQAQQANSVTQPTGDTWVRTDNTSSNNGSNNTVEMQNNGTTDFYGVMQFSFDAPQAGYRVSRATLRLTTRFKKGDSKVNVYGLNAEVTDDSNYGGLETAITTALGSDPIATFNLKGYNQWAPTDGAVVNEDGGASFRVISAWQNTIDLTSYVQGLATNSFAILLEKPYPQDNSSQVFSKEATDISLNDNSATFAASELVPQLTVTYEKIYAMVEEGGNTTYCNTLNDAFDAITSNGTITLYNDLTITSRCNTSTKTITVTPAKDVTISSTITNNIWILNNQSAGNLTFGSDDHHITIDGGNYSVGYALLAAEHGTTTVKNVTFKNCKGTSDNGVVHLKSQNSGTNLYLNNVTFDRCTANEGRGIVTVGTNNLYLQNAITFTDCSAGSYNFYLQNKFLRVGDLSTTQAAPFTVYYETPALKAVILSRAGGGDVSSLFELMNNGFGIIKDPSHYTDHKITEAHTMTMNAYGASTLILPYDAKIPAGVTAYTLNYTAGNSSVKATEVTGGTLDANTPVLININGDASTKYWFINTSLVDATTTGSGTHTEGALTGVYETTDVPADSYILWADATHDIGFYKSNNSRVGANRAYLTADDAGTKLMIDFDGTATGIGLTPMDEDESSKFKVQSSKVYNLAGQRMSRLQKGVNIVNGKKVLVK